jgi:hypothetical protein
MMPRKPEWIPDHAYKAYQNLSAKNKNFIKPIYFSEDNNLKNFWRDFSKGGPFFFIELNEHLIRWKNYFDKKQKQHQDWKNADDELKKIRSRIKSSLKIIEGLKKSNPVIKSYRFNDLEKMLNSFLSHEMKDFKADKDRDLKAKNKQRALKRQSYGGSQNAQVRSCGIALYNFFQDPDIQKDWRKSPADLKRHVCTIVNVLIDSKDTPLTEKSLTDAIKTFL